MNRHPHVAVAGATGAVGLEMLKTLERRNLPVGRLTLLASSRSAGKKLRFRGQDLAVKELTKDAFTVIDNSSAFRMDEAVPLVVPEINGADIKGHQGIIANPNCTTAITLMALYPLHRAFFCERIFASSYQAVSGTGAKAIAELERQVREVVAGRPATKEVYPHQIAFNVLPHVDAFLPSAYTKEEMKMQNEGRKIMHHPTFLASVTCVRVPVYRAHSVAVSAPVEEIVAVEQARAVLSQAPGPDVVDNP